MTILALVLSMTDATADIKRISAAELQHYLESGRAIAIDVRDLASFEAGHIPGARHLTRSGLTKAFVHELRASSRLIVVYCSCIGESTSAKAAVELAAQGVTNIAVLSGSLQAWVGFGGRLEATK